MGRSPTTMVEWPSEKNSPAAKGLALLHELARHIVDGRDVVGIEGVAKTEAVGQESRCRAVLEYGRGRR